jgi:hypothetical protein
MCIMEVRPGQRSATIAQAMAHNTSTVERDLDMFTPLLRARGETELLAKIECAHEHLRAAYAEFLAVFTEEVKTEVTSGHDHSHDHDHGSEREIYQAEADKMSAELLAEAHHDAQLARKYETR